MKKILLFLLAFFFFIFIASQALAEDNFSTDYLVSYSVLQNSLTHVNFQITLTNKTENYYASYYKVQLGVADMENIRVSDGGGQINPDITKAADGTTVGAAFNQKVVGLGKKLTFNFSFDTTDIAQNIGRITEVNIPGLSNQTDFFSFQVNVSTSQLGFPAYIKPAVVSASSSNLTFNKNQLGKSGVYIAYGDFQAYSFDLSYHLYNNNLFKVKTEIALPPTTNYQNIQIDQINPKPTDVTVDQDGNWLAQYTLSPSQKLDVRVTGKAKINLTPSPQDLSDNLKAIYLEPQQFWESDSTQIKSLAQELKTPQAIYDYVVKTLNYDFSRVSSDKPRLGATKVLGSPTSAVCLEFTDLFIALARANGIPAREVDGFAYTQNSRERPLSLIKDVLHAWPEYWDESKKTWIMVDPTWGNTTGGVDYFNTLDFDHFAFVIKGKDSSYPVPAGGYKLPGQEDKKDVHILPSNIFEEFPPVLNADVEISKSVFPWAALQGQVIIKNQGSQATPAQIVEIDTNILNPKHQLVNIEQIPPYGQAVIPLKFTTSSFLTNTRDRVKITIGQKSIETDVLISPFSFSKRGLLAAGGVAVAILVIIISAVAAKLWNLHIFRRKG